MLFFHSSISFSSSRPEKKCLPSGLLSMHFLLVATAEERIQYPRETRSRPEKKYLPLGLTSMHFLLAAVAEELSS